MTITSNRMIPTETSQPVVVAESDRMAEIQQRLEAYRSSGDFNDLWSGVSGERRHAGHRQIFAVTRAVLNDLPGPRHLSADDEHDVRAVGIAAYASGMGPLLGYWVATGTITADPATESLFSLHLAHGRQRAAKMCAHCLRLLGALGERDVVPILLKGIYTGRQFFPEPGVRPVADVDILIAPDEETVAERTLSALGYGQIAEEPGQTAWALRDQPRTVQSLDLDHEANPWAVDLHTSVDRRFPGGFWARMGDAPFHAVGPWDLDGYPTRVFKQPLLLTHLAINVSSTINQLQLIHLVQLVLVIRDGTRTGSLTWQDMKRLVDHLEIGRFVYPALELAERFVPGVLEDNFRRHGQAAVTRRVGRIIDHKIESTMIPDGRSIDDLLAWAQGPGQVVSAARYFLRANGRIGWGKVYRRRLRLLLSGRFSLRAGSRKLHR